MATKKKKAATKKKKTTTKGKGTANTTCRGGVRVNAGRPKGIKSFGRLYQEVANESATKLPEVYDIALGMGLDPKQVTIGDVITRKQFQLAASGNTTAIKDIADRIDRQAEAGMSKAQLTILANHIVDIINRNVMDSEVKSRMAEEIMNLVGSIDYAGA